MIRQCGFLDRIETTTSSFCKLQGPSDEMLIDLHLRGALNPTVNCQTNWGVDK